MHPHPQEETPEPGRSRWAALGAFLAVIVVLALILTWTSLRARSDADHASAAAQSACAQVEGLGQKCVTAAPGGEVGSAAAIVPGPSTTLPTLPGMPATSPPARPAGAIVGPEGSASAAIGGEPEAVNPGDDTIVGLTVREGRLMVTYRDGNVVDAGAVNGVPPAIVLIVSSPSASPSPAEPSPAPPPAATSTGEPTGSPAPAETGTP